MFSYSNASFQIDSELRSALEMKYTITSPLKLCCFDKTAW